MTFVHRPVLVQEVLEGLALKPGAVVFDATLGLGGHSEKILEVIGPQGRLIALDRDSEAIEIAKGRLSRYGDQVMFFQGSFGELGSILDRAVDAALFDLGVSSMQLEKADRGFSFGREGPLDMRMDLGQQTTAGEIVNRYPQRDLEDLIRGYGEERYAGRIARAIVQGRPFATTTQLAEAIRAVVPGRGKQEKIDPATRTFQAIRIAVNEEQQQLQDGLERVVGKLKPSGRVAVLSYHSLEDRRVKVFFREQARAGVLRLITRKPVRPSEREVSENPRSRSASLRVAEKA